MSRWIPWSTKLPLPWGFKWVMVESRHWPWVQQNQGIDMTTPILWLEACGVGWRVYRTGSRTLEDLERFWIKDFSQIPQAFISCTTRDFSGGILVKCIANNSGADLISICLSMEFCFITTYILICNVLVFFFITSFILNTRLPPNCISMLHHFIQITFERLRLAYYLTFRIRERTIC